MLLYILPFCHGEALFQSVATGAWDVSVSERNAFKGNKVP